MSVFFIFGNELGDPPCTQTPDVLHRAIRGPLSNPTRHALTLLAGYLASTAQYIYSYKHLYTHPCQYAYIILHNIHIDIYLYRYIIIYIHIYIHPSIHIILVKQ